MKIPVSWKSFLLFAHLALLIAAIALGRWLYAGSLGRSDALAVFNPYPLVTIADNLAYCPANPFPQITPRVGHVVSNPVTYVRDWYSGMNGRLSVAVMDSLIALAARGYPTPESFPWWLMRALSLYCLLAIPLNFMVALGWAWARRPGLTLVLLAAVWSVWITSPKVYIFTVVFDVLLTDRNIHMYVLTWMMLGVLGNWMGRSAWKWGLLAVGLVFLSSEQTIISAPILLLAAAWVGLASGAEAGRSWRWQACFYSAWTGVSAAIFFLSPGQRLRNTFLTMKPFGEFDLLEWYRQAVALGYGAILPRLPDALWLWHLILYGALGLLAAVLIVRRLSRAAPYRPAGDPDVQKLAGIALMAFAFLTAFLASMATLAVSPYFPPYAVCFPSLLLVLGLVFAFWLVLDGAAIGLDRAASSARRAGIIRAIGVLKLACVAGLPLLAAGALIGAVTVRSWPVMAAEYRQVMAQNHNRRQLYAEVARLRNVTGQKHFVLVNLWQAPVWGIHMDEVWAVAAYFRWRRMEDVVCLTEEEWIAGGRPQEELYLKLDCARLLAGQ